MIFRHGQIKSEIEGRIGQSDATTGKVMKDPPGGYFVLYRSGFSYIFMDEIPAEETQGPPTEGPTSPSTPPARNF